MRKSDIYLQQFHKKRTMDIEEAHDIVSATNPAIHINIERPIHEKYPTPHPERIFSDKPKRWCSKCPFPEGCVVCCLD
jgi:hypothetical protein